MNYFRTFLNSFRQRATAVRDYISAFVFGPDLEQTIDIELESEDEFFDAEEPLLVTKIAALKGGAVRHTIRAQGTTDPSSFLELCKPTITQIMKPETKVYIRVECTMKRINPADNTEETVTKSFKSQTHIVFTNDIEETYDGLVEEVLAEFAGYQKDGSGWSLKSTNSLLLSVVRWIPMRGSSYIPLPSSLKKKESFD